MSTQLTNGGGGEEQPQGEVTSLGDRQLPPPNSPVIETPPREFGLGVRSAQTQT